MRTITCSLLALALVGCTDTDDTDTDKVDSDSDAVDSDSDMGETDDTDVNTTACDLDEVGTLCTVAGILGEAQFSSEGLPATEAQLYLPIDMKVGPDGLLYILDFNNHRIRRIEADGTIHTLAGTGFLGDGPPGPAKSAAFNHPTGVAFNPLNPKELYIAAWHNSRIEKLNLDTMQITWECGTGGRAFGGDGGDASVSVLDLPAGIVFDDDGTLYIGDSANQVVRKVATDHTITTVVGTVPSMSDTCPEGVPAPCQVKNNGWSGDDGPALEAKLNGPIGQKGYPGSRIERNGRTLYLADTLNHVVRTVDMDDWTIHHLAGTGTVAGYAGDGGDATLAKLNSPADIAVDEEGRVYIADTYNHCVRMVDTDGTISTVIGVCEVPGIDGDGGPATSAHLWNPYGVEVSGDVLYVADTENHAIRAVRLR